MTYASIHKAYNYTRKRGDYWVMVIDATFTNISAISWRSVYWRRKLTTCRMSVTKFII